MRLCYRMLEVFLNPIYFNVANQTNQTLFSEIGMAVITSRILFTKLVYWGCLSTFALILSLSDQMLLTNALRDPSGIFSKLYFD